MSLVQVSNINNATKNCLKSIARTNKKKEFNQV